MSELDSKLSAPQGTGGRARASYEKLAQRWNGPTDVAAPAFVILSDIEVRPERWVRIAGRGNTALYELEDAP